MPGCGFDVTYVRFYERSLRMTYTNDGRKNRNEIISGSENFKMRCRWEDQENYHHTWYLRKHYF